MGWVLLKKKRFFPTLKQTPINLRQCVSAFKWFFTINFHMSLFLRSNSSSIKHFRIWPFLVGSKNMILSMFFSQYHYLTIDTYSWLTSKSCNMFSGDISLLRINFDVFLRTLIDKNLQHLFEVTYLSSLFGWKHEYIGISLSRFNVHTFLWLPSVT